MSSLVPTVKNLMTHYIFLDGIKVMFYYVGCFTLSFINVAIAQSKNRSSFFWFLASLLIGPVATFLLITLFSDNLKESFL
jgi:hypothetical protein